MKKQLFIILFLGAAFFSNAQIEVNLSELNATAVGQQNAKYQDKLSRTKTYFIVPDRYNHEELRTEISKIWDITELEFLKESEVAKASFDMDKSSFISFDGNTVLKPSGAVMSAQMYLHFWTAKGKRTKYTYGLYYLYPTQAADVALRQEIRRPTAEDYLKVLEKPKNVNNWSVGMVRDALIIIQKNVKEKKRLTLAMSKSNKAELKKIKKRGLHIPKYILQQNGMFKTGFLEEAELFKGFNVPYTLESMEAINKGILNAKDDYFYVNIYAHKYGSTLTVMNAKTNEIVYQKTKVNKTITNKALLKLQALIK